MDERIMAVCELANDLIFHKIPKDSLAYYADESLRAGKRAAKRFAGEDIRALYEKYGIEIRETGAGKGQYGVILRGQAVMDAGGCSVEIYRDSIKALAEHSRWKDTSLTFEQAVEVHLSHEFFHILEYLEHSSIAEKLEPVQTFSFLGLRRLAHVQRCGEVAAHAFAKELLGLPVLPNLYDYLYLMGTGKMTRSAFEDMLVRMGAYISQEEEAWAQPEITAERKSGAENFQKVKELLQD